MHTDTNGEDHYKDIRIKAKQVCDLLADDSKLADERAKAEKIKDVKTSGISSDNFARIEAMHRNHYGSDKTQQNHHNNNNNHNGSHSHQNGEFETYDHQDMPRRPSGDEPASIKQLHTEKKGNEASPNHNETPKKPKKKKTLKKTPVGEKKATASANPTTNGATVANTNNNAVLQTQNGQKDDFEVNFDPLEQRQGSAATAYAARVKAEPKRDIVADFEIRDAPVKQIPKPVQPTGDFDFLTQQVPSNSNTTQQQQQQQWTELATSPVRAGETKADADWVDPFGNQATPIKEQKHQTNGTSTPVPPIGSDVWQLAGQFVNIDNIKDTKPKTTPRLASSTGQSMSEMSRNQPSTTIFDDGLLGLGNNNNNTTPQKHNNGNASVFNSPSYQSPGFNNQNNQNNQNNSNGQKNAAVLDFVVPQARPSGFHVDLLSFQANTAQNQQRANNQNQNQAANNHNNNSGFANLSWT
jgi:hypothetical protein